MLLLFVAEYVVSDSEGYLLLCVGAGKVGHGNKEGTVVSGSFDMDYC